MKRILRLDMLPGIPFRQTFHADHWKDLENSGLTEDIIKESKIFTLPPGDLTRLFAFGNKKIYSTVITALVFPYAPSYEFARIKIFPVYVDEKGHRTKYLQPPKSSARLYIPRPLDEDCLITIIEGEKKTLSGLQYGLNAIGIGGIWNWVDTFGHLNSDFDSIHWEGKSVDIVPDSDVWTREDLLRAVLALATRLRDLGAEVLIVRMNPEGQKGLDDFFVAGNTIEDYRGLERVGLNSQFFQQCQVWFSKWKAEKAHANVCPHCEKGFKNLARHKCKKAPLEGDNEAM